jgi:hypothetical protein
LIRIHIHSHIGLMTQLPCKTPEGGQSTIIPQGALSKWRSGAAAASFRLATIRPKSTLWGAPFKRSLGGEFRFSSGKGVNCPTLPNIG